MTQKSAVHIHLAAEAWNQARNISVRIAHDSSKTRNRNLPNTVLVLPWHCRYHHAQPSYSHRIAARLPGELWVTKFTYTNWFRVQWIHGHYVVINCHLVSEIVLVFRHMHLLWSVANSQHELWPDTAPSQQALAVCGILFTAKSKTAVTVTAPCTTQI